MNIKISLLLLFIVIIKYVQNNENIDTFLNWGLKNNLTISSYIEVSLIDKNKLKFIAKENIPKKAELLIIPNNIMFNITKALKLIDSKSLNKQYKQFQKLNLTYDPNPYDFRKEESFLAYIFYLIQYKPKKYKKTKFYQLFESFLKSLNNYMIKSPLYYEQKQIDFFTGSLLSWTIEVIKKVYEEEINILSNNSYYKKYIDFDDYIHYRFSMHNKGLNIYLIIGHLFLF